MDNFDATYSAVVQCVDDFLEKHFRPFEGIETIATHGGYDPRSVPEIGCPVIPPITMSTTFQQSSPGIAKYDYSRAGNFSRECLEKCIAQLEAGDHCSVYSSGLACLAAITQLLSSGDHIIASDDMYGGSGRYLRSLATKAGLTYTLVDMREEKMFTAALQPNTRLVLIESPTNPLMRLVNIERISSIAHNYDKTILVAVDNTFMSPYFQRPLDLGADISWHSLTKYMNGHSDVVLGALVTRNHPELPKKFNFIQLAGGAVPSPFDCFMCLRGLRTLPVRMKAHMHHALTVAMMLERHPKVEKVIHPDVFTVTFTEDGEILASDDQFLHLRDLLCSADLNALPTHPQHRLALEQMRGFSGMVSVYLRCTAEEAVTFVKNVKIFALAESLGGYESLIEIPSIMTHTSVPYAVRMENGIFDNMIRLSVGLEDSKDLSRALYESLDAITSTAA